MKRALIATVLAGCSSSGGGERPTTFGGDRPVDLQVPANFDDSKQYPLILILHGYGASGFVQESLFGLKAAVTDGTAFVLAPEGTVDTTGKQFWNADPACCDFGHTGVDDSTYLAGLVGAVRGAWPIDRVWVIGHSNGGYMSYRLACDHADAIDGMIVLAGASASDPSTCHPSRQVNLLHMHGTEDTDVPYSLAMPSVQTWAGYDGCGTALTAGTSVDLDAAQPGAETMTQTAACPAGIDVELWSIGGAGHIPSFNSMIEPTIIQWFTDHPRS